MASGIMIQGKWATERKDRDRSGKFKEKPTTFRDRVTADGSSGFKSEAGRYHLYVALGCPWAHRTLIMREIKGLNEVISVSIVDPIMSDKGWMFSDAPRAIRDSVNHAQYLQEIYLCGDRLTEADICMFTTLYRFDSVYHGHFKCNLRRIIDYPNLWNYLKDLYQRPEFKVTCNLDDIKRGYYMSMTEINPNRIVPNGPIIDFDEPHDRDRFGNA